MFWILPPTKTLKNSVDLHPMRATYSVLISLAAGLLCSSAQAQVALTFAWPDGLHAEVTHTVTRTQFGSAPRPAVTMTTLYDMKASKRANSVLVSFDNMRFNMESLPPSLKDADRQSIEQFAQLVLPPFVISPSGEFLHIDDAAAYRTAVLTQFAQTFSDLPDQRNPRMVLGKLLSEEQLNVMARARWNQPVGSWSDATMEVGEAYDLEFRNSLPILSGQTVTVHSSIQIKDEPPCTRGGQARRCVRIEVQTRPNQQELQSVLLALFKELSPNTKTAIPEMIESLDFEEDLELITESEGLIPHVLKTSKRIVVTARNGKESASITRMEQTTTRYRYRDTPP
ncbi:hypothetical protein RQP54_01210 [Curvibacter sp. APW13]|uniref:hypothetical protein n=1 Tax=Curvibacter sp. APW13 TaxID=3077236 RepID=UPI0028E00E59|nr:hypothetical protein [Curvibacter sp. APW13]MDT8989475.1 hypothetical protein [Curvibacter sp. APW13]